jgi:hypothetical protein
MVWTPPEQVLVSAGLNGYGVKEGRSLEPDAG